MARVRGYRRGVKVSTAASKRSAPESEKVSLSEIIGAFAQLFVMGVIWLAVTWFTTGFILGGGQDYYSSGVVLRAFIVSGLLSLWVTPHIMAFLSWLEEVAEKIKFG